MASHRTKNRREPLRSGVLGRVFSFSLTFQNNRLGCAFLGTTALLAARFPFLAIRVQHRERLQSVGTAALLMSIGGRR